MDYRVKKGGLIGLAGAITVFWYASSRGFNQASFTFMLYIYVAVGILASLQASDMPSHGIMERVIIAGKEEENKLKRVFTGEEYKINGTVEKIQ